LLICVPAVKKYLFHQQWVFEDIYQPTYLTNKYRYHVWSSVVYIP